MLRHKRPCIKAGLIRVSSGYLWPHLHNGDLERRVCRGSCHDVLMQWYWRFTKIREKDKCVNRLVWDCMDFVIRKETAFRILLVT